MSSSGGGRKGNWREMRSRRLGRNQEEGELTAREKGRGQFTLLCAWGEEVGFCKILVSSIF